MCRKAAFFRRIAAMQCVQDGARTAWQQCYNLLLQAYGGYNMSVDPKVFPHDVTHGWPVLQLRVLHEIIYSARKMAAPAIAIRHLTFLLHVLFDHLTSEQRIEIAGVLESYTCRGEGTHQSLALDNGVILPPVPLLRLPTVIEFRPLSLPPHLQPIKRKSASESSRTASPFIYSPIQLGPSPRARSASKLEFLWVQGEVCEVELHLYNPMALELKILEMGLLTENVSFKSCPVDWSLPAESGVSQMKLRGTPEEPGELLITGYSTKVLGVRSHCRLRDLPRMVAARYHVTIVPALPWLQVTTSLSKADDFSSLADGASVVTSAVVSVFGGQSCVCQIQLQNCGREPVESIDVCLDSRVDTELLDQVLRWDQATIRPTLPLLTDHETSLTLHIQGASDFIAPACRKVTAPARWVRGGSRGHKVALESSDATAIEALVKLQYSGGPGMASGYYRHCVIAVTVEIQPSVLITRWQALPSERADYFVLVLDVLNVSPDPLQLTCVSHSKSTIVIPTQQSSRVSLEVSKCPTKCVLPRLPQDVSDAVCQHIHDSVNIRWKITSSDTCGVVSLDKLTWTNEDTAHLFASPLQWKIWLNVHEHRCGSTVYLPCGEEVRIKCQITNTSESVIRDVQFRMSCHQDTGIAGTAVTGKQGASGMGEDLCECSRSVVCVGSPTVSVNQCSLVFVLPGRFKLAFQCHGTLPRQDNSGATTPSGDNTRGSTSLVPSVSSCDVFPVTSLVISPPTLVFDSSDTAVVSEDSSVEVAVTLKYPALVELCVAQSGGS
ncbi:hypothetical protein NP493_259g02052 [Ridgeia piscesae]|uniref:Trs120/TRAPPC9 first Ig-like domain-containing protein n=1 Tax=Ridgeia piscesae TaxID=27915 RepID=A0AAD9NYA3_RIDPI|nr:hypothetical protein NP493_259g02052 [Ridgeia piscesae]